MGITLTRCATVLVLMMLLSGFPGAASARWPVGDGDSALGFGASYAAPDGQSRTHHGCDLLGSPGEPVLFPTAGTVRFAGSVPAPKSSMASMPLAQCPVAAAVIAAAKTGPQGSHPFAKPIP